MQEIWENLLGLLPYAAGAVVLVIICTPVLMLKIIAWVIRMVFLRVRVHGRENLPYSGPILLVSNHVSLLDLLVIQSVARQRVRFLVRKDLLNFTFNRFLNYVNTLFFCKVTFCDV